MSQSAEFKATPARITSDLVTDLLQGIAAAPGRLAAIASYTPRIAAIIHDALKARDPEGIVAHVGPVKLDLHETGGYYLSTQKFLDVTDRYSNRYRVTVEDITADNPKPLTSAERSIIMDALRCSNDPAAAGLVARFRERR